MTKPPVGLEVAAEDLLYAFVNKLSCEERRVLMCVVSYPGASIGEFCNYMTEMYGQEAPKQTKVVACLGKLRKLDGIQIDDEGVPHNIRLVDKYKMFEPVLIRMLKQYECASCKC